MLKLCNFFFSLPTRVFMTIKGYSPIFQNLVFGFIKESLLLRSKFKNSVETVNPFEIMKNFCILQLPISYCVSLTMVTITSYDFINSEFAICHVVRHGNVGGRRIQ